MCGYTVFRIKILWNKNLFTLQVRRTGDSDFGKNLSFFILSLYSNIGNVGRYFFKGKKKLISRLVEICDYFSSNKNCTQNEESIWSCHAYRSQPAAIHRTLIHLRNSYIWTSILGIAIFEPPSYRNSYIWTSILGIAIFEPQS